MKGVDFAYGWTPGLGAAIAAHVVDGEPVRFVMRYLTYPGDGSVARAVPPKGIFAPELADYRANGLGVGFFFQIGKAEYAGGAAAAKRHATWALQALEDLGVPRVAAHFAVDEDTTPSDYPALWAYQDALIKEMGIDQVGIYGEADIIDYAALHALASSFVQCEAWSGGRLSPHANVLQHARYTYVNGVGMDVETSDSFAGMWLPEGGTVTRQEYEDLLLACFSGSEEVALSREERLVNATYRMAMVVTPPAKPDGPTQSLTQRITNSGGSDPNAIRAGDFVTIQKVNK